jgi:hypothetical protein
MKIFTSGSCRITQTIGDGYNKVTSIHSQRHNFNGLPGGINFLGKMHNVKQHIQFLEVLLDKLKLPEYILYGFLSSYKKGHTYTPFSSSFHEDSSTIPDRILNIRNSFNDCDIFIFEIK